VAAEVAMNDPLDHPVLRVLRLRADARVPAYMSEGAAGMDLCAALEDSAPQQVIAAGEYALIRTGISIAIPVGYEAQVRPRSGLALKHGVTVLNSPGTIDSDYRGEVGVVLINHGSEAFVVKTGDRIAQLVIAAVAHARVDEVETLDATARGAGGYGSTGK
jgi:dUTP pyrophosphatase